MVDRAELEAAIERDPYDAAAHAVYGDWLIEQGDPRGDLAALNAATEWDRGPLRALLDFLADHPDLVPPGQLRWCGGYIQRAEVVPEQAVPLLHHGSARFLAELSIRNDVSLAPTPDLELSRATGLPAMQRIVDAIGIQGPRALRVLEVHGDRAKLGTLGDLTALSDNAPNLERLALAGHFTMARVELPQLQQLALRSFRMQPYMIGVFGAARWPTLRALDLQPGACSRETFDEIARWFDTDLPSLEELAISHSQHAQRLLVPLVLSRAMRHLRKLELRDVFLTDDHVTILEGLREDLAHLEHLDVSGNRLGRDAIKRLQALVPRVIAERQLTAS